MITKAQRTKLKKHLKKSFIPDIQEVLKEQKKFGKNGQEYSISYISQIFNGVLSNIEIEDAIFLVYEKRKEKLTFLQKERNNKL